MKAFKSLLLPVLFSFLFHSLTGQETSSYFNQWINVGNNDLLASSGSFDKVLGCPYNEGIAIAGVQQDRILLFYWNGYYWSNLASLAISPYGDLYDIIAWEDEIYLAGSFKQPGITPPVSGLIKWNGTSWESPGSITQPADIGYISALAVYENKLYAGGYFSEFGGISASNVACYDGSSWSAAGSGTNGIVNAMHETDSCVFIAGRFTEAGGETVNHIAYWDGIWNPLVSGVVTNVIGITEMGSINDTLFVFGPQLTEAGGITISDNIAYWDGTRWNNAGIIPDVSSSWITRIVNYDGKAVFAGSFYFGADYENFIYWNSTGLDTIPKSGLGEYNITDLVAKGSDLYVLGILSWAEPEYVKKWCSDGNCLYISGRIYHDVNEDCYYSEGTDRPLKNQIITIQPAGLRIATNPQGIFSTVLDASNLYSINYKANNYWVRTCHLDNYSFDSQDGNIITGLDFPLTIDPAAMDTEIELTGSYGIPSVHGVSNNVLVENTGSVDVTGGTLKIVHDAIPEIMISLCKPIPDMVDQDTLVYQIGHLAAGTQMNYRIPFRIPPPGPTGEYTTWTAFLDPGFEDITPGNNRDTLRQLVVNSYDPNDKQVTPAGETEYGRISPEDSILNYRIRFQNTGTYYAFNVFITDTIDPDLNIETLDITGYSHPMYFELTDKNVIVFRFDNIMLPDSNLNEPESHGYVSYKIKTYKNLGYGTELTNRADIYFDFNKPVATNKTLNTLFDFVTRISENRTIDNTGFLVFPNPAGEMLRITKLKDDLQVEYADIYSLNGQKLITAKLANTLINDLNTNELKNGNYILVLRGGNEILGIKRIIIIR